MVFTMTMCVHSQERVGIGVDDDGLLASTGICHSSVLGPNLVAPPLYPRKRTVRDSMGRCIY